MDQDLFCYDRQASQQSHFHERPQEPSREPSDQTIQAKADFNEDSTDYRSDGDEPAGSHDWPFRDRYLMERRQSRSRQPGPSYGSQDDYGVPYDIYNREGGPYWSAYPSDDETGSLDWDSSFDPFTSSTFRRGSIVLDSAAATPSLAPSPSSPSVNPAARLRSSTDALREFGKRFLSRASKHSSRKTSIKDESPVSGEQQQYPQRVTGHRSRHSGGSSTTNTSASVGRTRSNTVDSTASRLSTSAIHKSPAHVQTPIGLAIALPLADEAEEEAEQPPAAMVSTTDLTAPPSPVLQSPLQQQQQASESYFREHSPSLLPSLIRDEIFPDSTFLHHEATIATPSLPSPSLETLEASQHLRTPAPLPSTIPLTPMGLSVYHGDGEPGLAELMEQMQQEDAAFEETERSMTTSGWSSEAEINELRRRRRDNQTEWQAKVQQVLDEHEQQQQQTIRGLQTQTLTVPVVEDEVVLAKPELATVVEGSGSCEGQAI
ncbi:hypothetical protein BCR37DRAFT_293559 [Protomyces lactucae-debilis]|uniref:Uncharacterized protein n=1 Tax=Protomyces lactucae-debilis TaxID=2754530 RepID=A0A1Y2FGQ7_PROLT|nr:uncharacterized protein BCR37DRAFT_293559 [Protomyces lactucae-debilis]ORY83103.1 hypothetical protein BCR37DRAFT_293559 [Protomyces lactucae-debilis]